MPTPRPRLLYLSPVVPATTGNGLAMRAGMVLRLLARRYRVSRLVIRLYAPFRGPIPAAIADLCAEAVALPAPPAHPASHGESPPAPPSLGRLRGLIGRFPFGRAGRADAGTVATPGAFRGHRFDVVHVFRLAMLPFDRPYVDRAGSSTERHLDLDDIESITRRRLAELYRAHGRATLAERLADDAYALFRRAYTIEAAARGLASCIGTAGPPRG